MMRVGIRILAVLGAMCVAGACPGARADVDAAAGPVAGETSGRVFVREGGGDGRYRGRAAAGMKLGAGEAVLTGPGARVEWRIGERGRWRIGERVVWLVGAEPGDAELRAGTALAAVPRGARWTVGAAAARVELGEGVWLLTAVENEGLKIVALDGGEVETVRTAGRDGSPSDHGRDARATSIRLRAGEVVFARPKDAGFGPVVTIFLDELLVSSRLLTKFTEPLPQMERLRQQGEAQRERLSLVGNVHVGGATDAEGFQVIVPGRREETKGDKAEAPK